MNELAIKIILLITLIAGSIHNEANKPYSFNLSGQINLETRMDGGPYREIYSKSGYASTGKLAGLIPDMECKSSFIVAGQEYKVRVQFRKIDLNEDRSFLTYIIGHILFNSEDYKYDYNVDIYNPKGEKVVTNIIKKEHEIDNWDREINKDNTAVTRKGICVQTFTDPVTGIECIVETNYEANGNYSEREEEKDGKKEKYPYVRLDSDATVKVGFRKFLYGDNSVNNIAYSVDVVDWNLDGIINEEDKVYFDFMDHQFLPLNQQTRLAPKSFLAQIFRNKASKYEYLLHLQLPRNEEDKYLLDIERVK